MHNHYDISEVKKATMIIAHTTTYAYIALLPGHTPGNEANAYTIDASLNLSIVRIY